MLPACQNIAADRVPSVLTSNTPPTLRNHYYYHQNATYFGVATVVAAACLTVSYSTAAKSEQLRLYELPRHP